MVSVAAVKVKPTSSVAAIVAVRGLSPSSRCLEIFSTSTIASSTIIPTTNAIASIVIVSSFSPNIAITMNVPHSDVGIASPDIMVAFQSQRNGYMTNADNATAIPIDSIVARLASLI